MPYDKKNQWSILLYVVYMQSTPMSVINIHSFNVPQVLEGVICNLLKVHSLFHLVPVYRSTSF